LKLLSNMEIRTLYHFNKLNVKQLQIIVFSSHNLYWIKFSGIQLNNNFKKF
jgi:hypothetical protein